MAQEENTLDNNRWRVYLYVGEFRYPYELLDNEIVKVKEIISREVTRANEIALAPDKDGKISFSALNDELRRYNGGDWFAFSGISVRVIDSDGNIVCSYNVIGSRILVSSNDGEVSTLYEMDDNELEKYLVELASQKKEFSSDLSPGEKDDILNRVKSVIYKDSRRNKKGGKE